ncbi:phosphoenolpyruvate--protein phosphotransferase [Paraglaciecola psychrophila]|uniref:phosphoenolpyruvate--protein phosphotransferase n=1 Tax=Paraglaciecola psychrophila 170 TaxID=1129794 RepID=K6ZWD9_9ALTE|nr:phosphoenolpyruvate--protein phosphotransferase [Paraglaciecola psychrophila]AGH47042.1 phosphoenolpyruvate-protein phosphotransferase PtsP [Paraglaciecola psychrophila 170]GAC40206.1 phosphotransferase system, enzyme I, PtsP [Paraglaciecola psychrophila 170]
MLTTLKRIVQEVNQIPVFDDALSCLANRLIEALKVDSCSIYLADYEHQHFMLVATEGLAKSAVGQVSIGFSEGLVGLIGQREEPLNISDAQRHPRFKHYPEVQEDNYHAFLGAPIIHQRKVLGVLTLQQQHKRRFSEDEEAFLVTLAMQLAVEIANAKARGSINLLQENIPKDWQKSLKGVPGSSGLASGVGYLQNMMVSIRNHVPKRSKNKQTQVQNYRQAVKQTQADMAILSERIQGEVPDDVRAIFQLYYHLLDANSLGRDVEKEIKLGWDAPTSLKMVVENYIRQFQAMNDPYMRERAVDVEDMGNRVLANIMGISAKNLVKREPPEHSILVAEEVTAVMLAEFPSEKLMGIVSMRGSNNSHAAIMARAMGVPAVMGLSNIPIALLNEKEILLDGYTGDVIVSPNATIRREFDQLVLEEQLLSERIRSEDTLPAITTDNCEIRLFTNAGLSLEAEKNDNPFSDGVGLFRTEIPFMMRERFPTEQEQVELYRTLLEAEPNKPFTMRTLDVGGDKPLPYFPISEENPFLGWRGIRLTLDHPEIFLVQIRAMLRASIGLDNLSIMLPMITSVSEVSEAKRLIRQAFYEVEEEAQEHGESLQMPKIGVMLEVPAVLYQLPQLSKIVDFFSVGSNDLTQYLLAVDRNNSRVAELYDSYHPAVLSALHTIAKHSELFQVPVTVCGELAGEPGGVVLLLAMGYRKLSMNNHNLLKVKWIIRNIHLGSAEQLLAKVLTLNNPQDVREEINNYLESIGLGGLVRAGI